MWLFVAVAAATGTVWATEWAFGVLERVDRVAYPLLLASFASLATALVHKPALLYLWQRTGACALWVYFAAMPILWALGLPTAPSVYTVAVSAPWMLAYQLVLYVTWSPRSATLWSLALAAMTLVPLGFHSSAWPSQLGPVLVNSALAQAIFALALYGVSRQVRQLMSLLAPQHRRGLQPWLSVEDLTRLRMQELEDARRKAEQASHAKSAFLANMSHEIRTPMSGVLGMIDLLSRTPLNETQTGYVRTLQRSGRVMLSLLNDVLDLSKVEAGRVELTDREFDLARTILACLEMHRPAAIQKGLELDFVLRPGLVTRVRGDRLRLQQVLNNLISNAVKFTSYGSVIVELSTEAQLGPAGYRICVKDTGEGIRPDKASLLFRPFVQLRSEATRSPGGTGLGLAISKGIVEAMGGQVGVDSAPGRGSNFWFTARFSLSEPSVGAALWPDSAFDQESQTAVSMSSRSLRVLLVDDNEVNIVYGDALLKRLGHQVEIAFDGNQAVSSALVGKHDLVLMDCHLPQLDGWEATRRIREREATSGGFRRVIIALTASAMPEDQALCREAGMDDILGKPFLLPDLESKIRRHFPEFGPP